MVVWCYYLASGLGVVITLYCSFEVHYFLRMFLCGIFARFIKKKCHILDTTTVTGICLTTDLDTLCFHMNNARYFRELDFARVDFYERTQLYKTIISKGGSVVQGASTIRYRRFIKPFTIFRITSKIIYWDNQSIFMEHRFISLKDSFVHCIAICRQRVLNCSAEDVINSLLSTVLTTDKKGPIDTLKKNSLQDNNINQNSENHLPSSGEVLNSLERGDGDTINTSTNENIIRLKPEMPIEVTKWMEYNEISSKNLRNGC